MPESTIRIRSDNGNTFLIAMKGKFIGSPKKGAGSGWHAVHNIDYLKPQIGDSEIAPIRPIGTVLEDRAGSAGKCSGNVAMVRVRATDFL